MTMKGVGLAHTLAQAFDNSNATFGVRRKWTDEYIDELTTKDGKAKLLGPMLDVLRGDAEIVPLRRYIDTGKIKPGIKDSDTEDGIIVLDRLSSNGATIPERVVLNEFAVGVASLSSTNFYERNEKITKPKTHIDVPDDRNFLEIEKNFILPKYLLGYKLPGIALRDFYAENPHHIPEYFSSASIILFWGTICKNDFCYYVPGLNGKSKYGRRICTYEIVDGKDVLDYFEVVTEDAAVFI